MAIEPQKTQQRGTGQSRNEDSGGSPSPKRRRTNYERGRDREYRVKLQFKDRGLIVHRLAGSHGPFDLIVIDKTASPKDIKWVQVKPPCFSKAAADRLREEFSWLNGTFTSSFWVCSSAAQVLGPIDFKEDE